ncbi:hypothetical protein [Haloarchaeobius sp. TZWSO28]|uniref:hypothetical protein n=1 Tax=Haloarchaeobius sp. TZWSO28 TaxID=3446119 RepID=UPI003EBD09B2
MRKFFALLVLIAAVSGLPSVSAQEQTTTTANNTTTTTAPVEETNTIRQDFGEGVTLIDIKRNPGEIVLVLEADLPATLLGWQDTAAAMNAADRRSSRSGISAVDMSAYQHKVWLDSGRNRVVLPVETRRGAASVVVWTNEKQFVLSEPLPQQNPLETFGGTQGVFAGAGTSVLAALAAAGWILRKEAGEVIEA